MEIELGRWLSESIALDPSALHSATIKLQAAEASPGFAMSLLSLSAVGQDPGQRTAAAIYLKNYVRNHWTDGGSTQLNERLDFRNRLVQVLLDADAQVVKHLAEAYSLIIANDFVRENTWPDLVTALRTAVQSSNLVNGAAGAQWKTVNALVVLQTTIRPFQYFLNPKMAREPVPAQLELIAEQILVPLCMIFHHLVQAEQLRDMTIDALEKEHVLLICCKCFHLAVRSHMPSSLVPSLPSLNQDLMVLLDSIAVDKSMAQSGELRLKIWKRCLQIYCTLVTRHRKHTDRFMPGMVTLVLKVVKQKPLTDIQNPFHLLPQKFHSLRERIISLAFDLISHVLETGPGWRLVASHFSSLLEDAIFPTIRMSQKDVVEWGEDPDEYMNKNLPSDLGEVSGWRDDLYTPRKSALNLLGVIALSKGPPMSTTTNKILAAKRKKGGKNTKGKGGEGSSGQLLVIPFLSKYVCPSDSSSGTTDTIMNYFGVLLGYGSLKEFFKVQSPDHVALLLRTRVLPLYSMSSPSPYLIANANWLLGELADCLPEELKQEIYNALLKALDASNVGNISWRLVRASAAGALAMLLQEEYEPVEWVNLLQTTISEITNKEKEDACHLLQLLATAAEIGEEKVALHVPAIISTIKGNISRHIPPAPEAWPQVVDLGFSALASMAQCWDNAEPGENENGSISLEDWKAGSVLVACSFSDLLQQAWLSHMKEGMVSEILPPPSCLNEASVLLCSVLKYINESELMAKLKVEALLQIWANLIAEWSAWEEEEDLAVFEAIEEATAFNEKFQLKNFIKSDVPAPPAPPVAPRSIVEAIATFISSAIELAYPAATWRACLVVHSLLHIPKFSFESDGIRQTLVTRFVQASYSRFQQLKSGTVPLGKPLVLVIAACYQCFPSSVEKILLEENGMHDPGNGLFKWAEALACLANDSSEPCLLLESELKLGVMTLVKVLEHLLAVACNQMMLEVVHSCYQSLLEATIRLKEVQEAEDREDYDDTEEDGDDDKEESDEEDEDSDDGGHEETEEEFLERYAETARELENELVDEVDTDENGQEIELGLLGMADHWAAVFSLIQKYHCHLINGNPLPQELVCRFLENFPSCTHLFS